VLKVRVLIADDHGVVAGGLRSLIEAEPDMEVVDVAGNGREAVRLAVRTKPDVVLMDHAMPELNGTEAARAIHARRPHTRIVILSMHADAVHIRRALQAGASGYLTKKSAADEVVKAIREVHDGRRYISRRLTEDVLNALAGEIAEDPLARLSARERQVLQLVAEGCSMAEIGGKLSLSINTVETYRGRMMEKLGLEDLAALIRFAIRQGVIALE
jgi:DNA-binding NarL/FixJ family response regulator